MQINEENPFFLVEYNFFLNVTLRTQKFHIKDIKWAKGAIKKMEYKMEYLEYCNGNISTTLLYCEIEGTMKQASALFSLSNFKMFLLKFWNNSDFEQIYYYNHFHLF